MVIRRMTATFGCLDNETLELQDGLNVLHLPNERGKSTWSAFVLAMFYGIDTGERAAKGRLPTKTKYQPWNGKPMEGILELEHQGKTVVLQRTSQRNKPMSQFRAYDKATGLELPELTAENCGVLLLGVERSVFRRTAFLSGDELLVTEDEALAQRLENLAAAGSVQDNYPAAAAKLKLWKNRCRYHQNGLIPETEAKLAQLQETLDMAADLRRRRLETMAQWSALQAKPSPKARAAEALAQAAAAAEQKAARAADLPPEERLRTLLAKLEQTELQESPEAPCPPALQGIAAEAILPKAQRDVREYEQLTRSKGLPWLLAALAFAVLAAVLQNLLPLLGTAALAGYWLYAKNQNGKKAGNIEKSYGNTDIMTAALARRDWLLDRDRIRRQSWEIDVLLEEIADFAPQVTDRSTAIQALKDGLAAHEAARAAREAWVQTQLQWQAVPNAEKEQAAALRLRAESLRSQEEALGGWEKLDAKRHKLEQTLSDLQAREQALALAQTALDAAHAQLAQVYAPRLTAMAGAYLQWLTAGRYDGLILQQGLQLLAREQATGLTRPLAALSRGTQDQCWLALRLAMTALLLPKDVPILLDDALVTFDQTRTEAALALLEQEPRQVVVFRCK